MKAILFLYVVVIVSCFDLAAQEGMTQSEIVFISNSEYELEISYVDTSQPHRPFTWIVDSSDLGIAEIRKAKNGEYYTIHRAFNGEAMMVSETVKNKAHLIDISLRYYPNFMIVDNTHLKPKRVKYNIILE